MNNKASYSNLSTLKSHWNIASRKPVFRMLFSQVLACENFGTCIFPVNILLFFQNNYKTIWNAFLLIYKLPFNSCQEMARFIQINIDFTEFTGYLNSPISLFYSKSKTKKEYIGNFIWKSHDHVFSNSPLSRELYWINLLSKQNRDFVFVHGNQWQNDSFKAQQKVVFCQFWTFFCRIWKTLALKYIYKKRKIRGRTSRNAPKFYQISSTIFHRTNKPKITE